MSDQWLETNAEHLHELTLLARHLEKQHGDTPYLQAKRRAEIA